MSHGYALGLSITDAEIALHLVDTVDGAVIAQNDVALPFIDDNLFDQLDRMVASLPHEPSHIAVACTDPAVRAHLADRARTGSPTWLEHAAIISATAALSMAVSDRFADAKPLVVAHLDHLGHPEAADPLMLIDPATNGIVATAPAYVGQPAYTPSGADALADAMAALPVVDAGIEMVVAAGAGADLPGAITELSRATGLPVHEIGGRYALAFGAALVAGRMQPVITHRRSAGSARSHIAVAVVGVAAALVIGGLTAAAAQDPFKGARPLADTSTPITSTSTSTTATATATATTTPQRRPLTTTPETPTPSDAEATSTTTPTSADSAPGPETIEPTTTSRRTTAPRPRTSTATPDSDTSTRPEYTPPTRTPATTTTRTSTTSPVQTPNSSDANMTDSSPSSPAS